MKRIIFCGLLVILGLSGCSTTGKGPEGDSPAGTVAARSTPGFQDITLRGELGTRQATATANVLTRPDRYSLDSFRASASGTPGALWWDWPGDQIGRMLSLMHVAEGYGWTTVSPLRRAVAEVILPLQTDHGNFGPKLLLDQTDARLISGNAFGLRGLADAYEDTKDARYLEAAQARPVF